MKRDLAADLTICQATFEDCGRAHVCGVIGNDVGLQYAVDVENDYGRELVAYTEIEVYARFIAEARTGWPHSIERALDAEKRLLAAQEYIGRLLEDTARQGVKIKLLREENARLRRQLPVTNEQAAEQMRAERKKTRYST